MILSLCLGRCRRLSFGGWRKDHRLLLVSGNAVPTGHQPSGRRAGATPHSDEVSEALTVAGAPGTQACARFQKRGRGSSHHSCSPGRCQVPAVPCPAPRTSDSELDRGLIGIVVPLKCSLLTGCSCWHLVPALLAPLCWGIRWGSRRSSPGPQAVVFWSPLWGGHTSLRSWTPQNLKNGYRYWTGEGDRDRSQTSWNLSPVVDKIKVPQRGPRPGPQHRESGAYRAKGAVQVWLSRGP